MFDWLRAALNIKIDRDAFLYFEPNVSDPGAVQFAQCGTCRDFLVSGSCRIFAPNVPVTAGDSCGLYVRGEPRTQRERDVAVVGPAAAGFRKATQVRCENCVFFHGGPLRGRCGLFAWLSGYMFKLDPDVAARGCCNAWSAKKP